MACEARRYGDTTMCGPCGLQWDTNDPEPPACLGKNPSRRATDLAAPDTGRPYVATITAQIPTELPSPVAEAMRAAYIARIGSTGSGLSAMQAAYRVFLDSLP